MNFSGTHVPALLQEAQSLRESLGWFDTAISSSTLNVRCRSNPHPVFRATRGKDGCRDCETETRAKNPSTANYQAG